VLAADDSGDPGLDVARGASPYFALALVQYDEEDIRERLRALRQQQGLAPHFEYHFAHGPSRKDKIRDGFMRALAGSSISGAAVIVTKAELPEEMQRLSGPEVLAHQLCALLLRLPDEQLDKATVLLDGEKKGTERLRKAAKRLFRQHISMAGRACHLEDMTAAESHRNDGIMVADMIVGAAHHVARGKSPHYLTPLARTITIIRAP